MLKLKTVEASGGLVIDPNERLLFIFKDGRWDLPKGLVGRALQPGDNALQEVHEETGIPASDMRVMGELIPTHHISKYGKEKTLKITRWFLIQCSNPTTRFTPQRKEGIEHCAWIPLWDLDRPLANCPARIAYLINFWLKARRDLKG